MKLLAGALASVFLLSGTAHAGTLKCSFTEPFFTLTFTSADGKLVRSSADETDPETGAPIPSVLVDWAKLIRDDKWQDVPQMRVLKDGKTFLIVRLREGSDGMSDQVFPFEGIYSSSVGGCETDKAPAYNATEVWEDFGIE
jgi:uncharacterized membrane protein